MKRIHFVGIKGVGMAPLAILAKQAGCVVDGCDVADEYITDILLKKEKIPVAIGFDKTHLKGVDVVITTGAHGGYDNPEVKDARSLGIPVYTQGEALGLFMEGEFIERDDLVGISVTGCHGKTTTTAMVATLLSIANVDPSWVIGTGDIPSLGSSGKYGKGKYFVAEADEYATEPFHDKTPKFLWQHPRIGIITNIEFDHPDLYASLDDVRNAYEKFARQVAGDSGVLIVNGDDPEIQKLLQVYTGEVITFGLDSENDYIISKGEHGEFSLQVDQEQWNYTFKNEVVGLHNIKNATAAIITAREIGIDENTIQQGLAAFVGTKRRLEYKGTLRVGAELYDDYAHHPTEIKTTIASIREKYPNKKIHIIFQPHTFSRTKLLFDQFIDSLELADIITMITIYPSAREPFDASISSEMMANALREKGKHVDYLQKPTDMVQYVKQNSAEFGKNIVLVTMGAGDIYQIAEDLLKI